MKRLISVILSLLSALVIFNLFFFLCVEYDGNGRAWICYLFFHIAYILFLIGFLFTSRRRFAVLNSGIYGVSIIYLVLTVITCLFFYIISDYSIETEIFVFLIELLFYMLYFHYCYQTNRKAEKGIIDDLRSSSKRNSWIAELNLLKNFAENENKTKQLNTIIGEIKSSPALSNSYTRDIDNEILSLIHSLKINYNNIQLTELDIYKNKICTALRKRSEILRCSYHKT